MIKLIRITVKPKRLLFSEFLNSMVNLAEAKKILVFVIACLAISNTSAQNFQWNGEINAGIYGSKDFNPFWMTTNTDGFLDEQTTYGGIGEFSGEYALSKTASLEGGLAFFYRNKVKDEFQRRDLYLQFKNSWLKTTLGAKKDTVRAQGLSATNKRFLNAGNTRPLSGLEFESNTPIKISNTFGIEWGIAHYALNDDRYVDQVRVHYKRLALITQWNENNRITAQITHYAQWAGTSPTLGRLPNDFNSFVSVFFARGSSEIPNEAINALGNHLGSYIFDYEFKTQIGGFSMYHEHPFEDGSGSGWANFPDGVWGIHFQPSNKKVFSGILYEYINTLNQSVSKTSSGADDYFNNGIYRSGWSYDGRIIGMPFILYDNSILVDQETFPIISNRTRVHHLGFLGTISGISWKVKSTFATHYGTFRLPFIPKQSVWHTYVSLDYSTTTYGALTLQFGADMSKHTATTYGAGLKYRYSI